MSRTINAKETEYWLIPKRNNVHQAWCLIDGIMERNYDGHSWNPNVQNNLGVNLKKWGATSSGKNISPQAIRTLAAYVQFLGFVYIDTSSTPNIIRVTEAGKSFWKNNRHKITRLRNLNIDKDRLLKTADEVRIQMEKLQFTNPVISKKCTDIQLFPFRVTLRLLKDLEYLDMEELAMFVFKMKNISEYQSVVSQIRMFRKLTKEDRDDMVSDFKKTKLGNISLVKAPSTRYYASLCESTGIISIDTEAPQTNMSRKLTVLRIKDGCEKYADDLLDIRYVSVYEYDFRDNLKLWISYYGDPDKISTPVDAEVINSSGERLLAAIYDKNRYLVNHTILNDGESFDFPAFEKESYEVVLYEISTGRYLEPVSITPSDLNYRYEIHVSTCNSATPVSFNDIRNSIIEHIKAKHFNSETTLLLEAIKKVTGIDKLTDTALRGSFLESEFYRLLSVMKTEGRIDDVIWHGKYGQMGLPVAAPGGKNGVCDLLFTIDDTSYVLELTTMKSKSQQEKAEAASVPDHVRIEASNRSNKVKGIFAAPILHDRVVRMMLATAASTDTELSCITINDLIEIFEEKDRTNLKNRLNSL